MKPLALLLLCLAAPAHADLQFDGRWPNESQVRAEFSRFPPRLQERLKTTQLRLRIGPAPGGGNYNDHERVLTVSDPRRMSVLDHEAGHVYFALAVSAEERASWPHFWRQHRGDFPTRYSRTDAQEGFAESFRTCFDGSHLRPVVRERLRELGVP